MATDPRRYRVRFKGRPDLDSDDFSDYAGNMQAGLEVNRDGVTWRVIEIVPAESGGLDTAVFELVQWKYES